MRGDLHQSDSSGGQGLVIPRRPRPGADSRWLARLVPRPETLQLTTAFRLKDPGGGTDRGRVHVTAQPAFQREDNLPSIVLTLVARGEPAATDEGALLYFLRMGHEWIVRGFADLTTPAMHEEWERLT